jgi:hypothetical protein
VNAYVQLVREQTREDRETVLCASIIKEVAVLGRAPFALTKSHRVGSIHEVLSLSVALV